MNQNLLNIFCTLYENRNMHKTAEQLFLSQQAVSKNIRSLEEELEIKLFLRSNTGVVPTDAGDTLYQESKIIQKQYRILHRKMDAVKNGRKTVLLVCAYGTMFQIFPLIRRFEEENPDIEIKWKELPDVEVEKRLMQEQADLAVNVKSRPNRYLKYIPLYHRKICLLVYRGHRLYEEEQIWFEDLQDENIILEGEEFQIYSLFREFCERKEVYPNIVAETSDIGLCHYMAELREGLAITIDFVAEKNIPEGVRAIPFEDPEFRWEAGLQIPMNDQEKEETKRLIRFMTAAFDDNLKLS